MNELYGIKKHKPHFKRAFVGGMCTDKDDIYSSHVVNSVAYVLIHFGLDMIVLIRDETSVTLTCLKNKNNIIDSLHYIN